MDGKQMYGKWLEKMSELMPKYRREWESLFEAERQACDLLAEHMFEYYEA
jgi:hypothetical protein